MTLHSMEKKMTEHDGANTFTTSSLILRTTTNRQFHCSEFPMNIILIWLAESRGKEFVHTILGSLQLQFLSSCRGTRMGYVWDISTNCPTLKPKIKF